MNVVSLVSSGIDSPVATYVLSSKVDHCILVHADNKPFSDERENAKFVSLVKQLRRICNCSLEAVVIPHGRTLQNYQQFCEQRFTCVFCKRMIVRYAEVIAKKHDASALIMGDSLGQVASQTLQNLSVVEQASSLPILRPLIGFDKEEIITIAKDIGTYELSIAPSSGCSAVPAKPATKAKLEKILDEEEKVDLQNLVQQAVEQAEYLRF